MKDLDNIVILVIVAAITIIELFALSQKINGTALAVSLSGLGGIGGYFVKGFINKRKEKQ